MSGIKKALTRKFGPLPAWAWAGIGGVALWLYRRHAANNSNSQQQNPAYVGPYGANPYPIDGGIGGGAGIGGGGDTTGGGGSTPSGPGTNNDNSNQPPDSSSPPPPQTTAPASISATRTKKPKGRKFSTKAGTNREDRSKKKTKANPRSRATFGSSHTRKEKTKKTKKKATLRPHTTTKVKQLSHKKARKVTRR